MKAVIAVLAVIEALEKATARLRETEERMIDQQKMLEGEHDARLKAEAALAEYQGKHAAIIKEIDQRDDKIAELEDVLRRLQDRMLIL